MFFKKAGKKTTQTVTKLFQPWFGCIYLFSGKKKNITSRREPRWGPVELAWCVMKAKGWMDEIHLRVFPKIGGLPPQIIH